ncbi:hypothetical protein [Nocardiopsis potens]|uniref:hypothetical protein n=1 Tax=Nocardiopsis potens TaxID=1246458 RepID=UPI0009DA9902|nr:hypothetical protein [Nocardiopsis potens]
MPYRRPACLVPLDLWLWAAALAMLAVGGAAHASGGPVAGFTAALAAVAVTSAVMGRAVDQLGGRLRPAVIGTFQAVIGNVPELIIGVMALQQGLYLVVQAAVIGSTLNLLLLGNGLAFVVGGLRHRTLPIEPDRTQITRVALVMLITILMAPALAVMLRTPAGEHASALSYVSAAALLLVFAISLPTRLRANGDMSPPEQRSRETETGQAPPWPLWLVLAVLAASGLLIGVEADWFTDSLEPAVDAVGMTTAFVGLFIVSTVGNLSQIGPAVQLAWRGDADTATAITMEGSLQVALLLAPLLTLLAPLVGAGSFTLIFPPMMIVATIAAVILVVFVTIDGKVNAVEGAMLLALYAVLGSLFWWG